MEQEILTFGADGTEVVWFAELTEEMIDRASLNQEAIAQLFEELNDAVATVCEAFGVIG